MVNEGGPVELQRLLGPVADIGRQWIDAMEWSGEPATVSWAEAAALADTVVRAADVRGESRVASSEVLATLTGHPVGGFPTFEDMTRLRGILRSRVVERLPQGAALEAIDRLDGTIDELVADRIRQQVQALESAAFLDPLTSVWNRRALDRDLGRELARSSRYGRSVSVVAIDVDGLKQINDVHGHAAGDDALCRLAAALVDGLRIGDSVYRVGGDEFVIVLPETEVDDVAPLLVRTYEAAPPYSFGVASAPADASSAAALLAVADAKLLEGRRITRNRPQPSGRPPVEPPAAVGGAPVPDEPAAVVALLREEERYAGAALRLAIEEVASVTRGREFRAEVTLRHGNASYVGRATGSSASSATLGIVAAAALAAVVQLDDELATAHIAVARTVPLDDSDIALVHLVIPEGNIEDVATGAAPLRDRGAADAIVRAVLDALNRRLAMRFGVTGSALAS